MRLGDAALAALPADVTRPAYDRSAVEPGIVHLGIGAFHRAHQAVYVDDCLAAGDERWGIVGASLRSADTRDALAPQNGLYTLAVRDSAEERLRVIGSIGRVIVAPEGPSALLDALGDPRIRLVTLTITEKGYLVDLANGALRSDHPDVAHDLANPGRPRTALGFLAEAIARRRAAGHAPFAILSCDNLPRNGRTLKGVLTAFARARDPGLAAYVEDHIACPSSMVDRIVPATTDADRAAVAGRLGREDAWPVMGEPFSQWVIEDDFPQGRPEWERCGAEFVADVVPFEHMKLRLLNGAHTAIAALGRLAGRATVAETIGEPAIRGFIEALWAELVPTLSIPPAEAWAYTHRLLARFDNTALKHRTEQIAGDASQKIPQRLVAPLRERLAAGAPCEAILFAVAAWIRSCGGRSDAGAVLALNDPVFQAWTGQPDQVHAAPAEVVRAFLGFSAVFGEDLRGEPRVAQPLAEMLDDLARFGALEALRRRFPQGAS